MVDIPDNMITTVMQNFSLLISVRYPFCQSMRTKKFFLFWSPKTPVQEGFQDLTLPSASLELLLLPSGFGTVCLLHASPSTWLANKSSKVEDPRSMEETNSARLFCHCSPSSLSTLIHQRTSPSGM
ncbi:hypothetical protein AMECASPLE_012675 [Ameca splendens]|uniref:Uncharacterized protein n=1 Tax=Ameca splendens TaxID=208324 RepID=A0ABV0Y1C9_9TELE